MRPDPLERKKAVVAESLHPAERDRDPRVPEPGSKARAAGPRSDGEELRATSLAAIEKHSQMQAIMDALPIAAALVDAQGGSLAANAAYEELWGQPRPLARSVDDYGAYKAWWVATGLPVRPEEWASARAVQRGETVVGQEFEIERFDGQRQFILNSAAPLRDALGRIVGSAVAIQNITALKRAEAELRGRHAELETLTRAMVGRELRMIELKQEVNALCARLGEPPRYRLEEELAQP